jgi:tRNA threonylcarbamoyladenosine biosynthesis protein TsaE
MAMEVEGPLVLESHSEEETELLGELLGELLEAGDVIALEGALGAGKTCLVHGLARGLGVPPERRIASPTFTILNEHPGRVPLYHADFYRLDRAEELYEIGFGEYLEARGVLVVEWFDRIPDAKPQARIDLRIDITGEADRRLIATAHGARAETVIAAWRARLGR